MLYAPSGDPGVRATLVRPRGRRGVEVKSLSGRKSCKRGTSALRVDPLLPAIQHRQQETPNCRTFKPSGGLEPPIPPYHGGFALREGDRGTALVTAFLLQSGHFVCQQHPSLEEP